MSLPALANLWLEDSYVLDIQEDGNGLRFKMDLVLLPEHPKYHEPRLGEQYCYEPGWISVVSPRSITWIRKVMRPFSDAAGEIDYGSIDSWQIDGDVSVLEGDWGQVEIAGGAVSVTVGP